jgi:transcriptional regulator with XRE-family HTH domain
MVRARSEQWRQEFGEQVRRLRAERGVSQEALAHAAGIAPRYLSDVECGKRNIALDNIRALAEALGVSPAVFFCSDG